MTSAIYASLAAFLIVWLSLNAIKKRYINKVSVGDDGVEELKLAIAAQSNAIEYIPIALMLLFAVEYNQGDIYLVHVLGIALISDRVIHAIGLLSSNLKRRVLGVKLTLYTILGLAVSNFGNLPYAQFKL